ncbi:Histidine kinase-, DNA gyrase B-, and HSP90-like ATPase [Nakamurella panacisegetis]|uniref:histidine kinase n=1 Tax=Nakamurella panacisegetis TaxID=1090615 RepID=A0A1H0MGY9_9ACTN|nr:ATP-binding protein [Nakamurella panacisegetis]SDO79718.1 Histidine kinase-, DNA gyrase B-, and HSP90-like ATPase [Nakamurella panacisegetis]
MTIKTDPIPCDIDELRTLFLFEKLNDEQLDWICRHGHTIHAEPGDVYAEGEPATCFYVLLSGTLVMSKLIGGEQVEITRSSQVGAYTGAWQAYMGDRVPQVYNTSMRVVVPSRLLVIDAADLATIMQEWFPMAVHLLEGMFIGQQNMKQTTDQRERLLALGSLSAGLTHELNNPAAAAVRATSSLRDRVAHMRQKLGAISAGSWDRATLSQLIGLQEKAVQQVAKAPALTPLEASDREDALSDWFEDHGIRNGWELAPTYVQAGLTSDWLDGVDAVVGPDVLEGAVRWINYTVETELLMNEIEDSVTRISTLVQSAKQYSQLDRAPFQVVDVHELLDATLLMLSAKIGKQVTVVKDYDRTLPHVAAYASELNQVWTNTIDNAIQAMAGVGTLTIRTARDRDWLLVEIGDTGPGIPDDIKNRIFEPFFTTKPVGQGTGLGLDISWRIVVKKHHGDLKVVSQPGDTRFQIRLPLTPPENAAPTEQETTS